jgi:hypothetical protein
MSAKDVHAIEQTLFRTINGNLDGSIDHAQAVRVIRSAVSHSVAVEDIVAAFHVTVGDSVDGVSLAALIGEARAPRRHGDN